jgi:hypothetical protein
VAGALLVDEGVQQALHLGLDGLDGAVMAIVGLGLDVEELGAGDLLEVLVAALATGHVDLRRLVHFTDDILRDVEPPRRRRGTLTLL